MRRQGADIDPGAWPAFDVRVLQRRLRKTFASRREAVELYANRVPVVEILARTGVHRRQLYRLIDHCSALHEDGRIFGWRGLVPYVHVADYQRAARIELNPDGNGAAGAFSMLLRAYRALIAWLASRIRDRRIALRQISTDGVVRRHDPLPGSWRLPQGGLHLLRSHEPLSA